jgi:hypothetical protein
MILPVLLTLLSVAFPADGELSRAGISDKDLEKTAKEVLEYFDALAEDERTDQKESLEKIQTALEKSAKRAKASDPLLTYLGDFERMLEFAKVEPRAFKTSAGKGFFKHAFEEPYDGVRLGVMLSLPKNYTKSKDLLPVIVALKPTLDLSGKALDEKVEEMATAMYADFLQTHIIMVPLGVDGGSAKRSESAEVDGPWSSDEGLYAFYTGYRVLLEQVRFDRSRVLLDGWGDASIDALRIATTSSFFGGLALRSGAVAADGLIGSNLSGVPVVYIAGAEDGDAADEDTVRGVLGGDVDLVHLAEAGSALAPGADTQKAFATWASAVKKDLVPGEVQYKLGDIRFQAKDWCKAAEINRRVTAKPTDPDFPRFHAVVDRGMNRIEIESVNVSEMEVFLSHALVDMSRKVTIVVNGETLYSRTPQPSLRRMLENRFFNNSQDYGLYTDQVLLEDIPANVPGRG